MDKTEFIEAVKEGLRVVVLAILPVIIAGVNLELRTIMIDWKLVYVVGALAILRFIDSALHRYGKEKTLSLPHDEISPLEKGLVRF